MEGDKIMEKVAIVPVVIAMVAGILGGYGLGHVTYDYEPQLQDFEMSLGAISAEFSGLSSTVTNIGNVISQLSSSVAELQEKVTALEARIVYLETLHFSYPFFDSFDDGTADGWTQNLGTWNVVGGEYQAFVPDFETGISTVDFLILADCVIEAEIKFTDDVGFNAQIVFRYADNEHYYAFGLQ